VSEALLRAANLSKRFSDVVALEGVTLTLAPGEVLGVVGRRGSGKSTLLHLLSGVHPPSTGALDFDGRRVSLNAPHQAQRLGIRLVHQKPVLAEQLDVIHNVFLGQELCWPPRVGIPNWRQMARAAAGVFEAYELPEGLLYERPGNLSDEQRQVVALARALVPGAFTPAPPGGGPTLGIRPARLLLLDEPWAALNFQRQQRLLEQIETLAGQGAAIVVSSDNLNHLFAVTHRILVLYEGRPVADRRTADCTPREIVELIVGTTRPEQVTPIIWALESYHTAQQQTEELRQAQATLRENLEAQGSLNRQLIERLRDQVVALDQLNTALQAAHRRLLSEREQERKYLARELHDQVIQDLLSFNYRLEDVAEDGPAGSQREEVAGIRAGIRQVVSDLRQLCSDLRPPTIDSHGLPAAIRSDAQEWADRNGVSLKLEIDPDLGRLPEAIELSVFRIVQEGLRNIRKHAAAREVRLCLQRTPTASLLMRLSDDGRGLAEPPDLAALSAQKHFGLVGISERVALLGGTLKIESPASGGVTLQIEIPSPYPSR
jgi:signal transduction histidine kinase